MPEKKSDRVKYGLLRAIDVSGFKAFDPVVRLAFGEEARKQTREIFRFLVTPALFILCCLWIWSVAAPRHKTKSGEVPTPARVVQAAEINHTLDRRENEKEADFNRSGSRRTTTLAAVEEALVAKSAESEQLKQDLATTEKSVQADIAAQLAPLDRQIAALRARNQEAEAAREQSLAALAELAVRGEAGKVTLVEAIRQHKESSKAETEAVKEIEIVRQEVLADPPKALKEAQMASNTAANEVQHLKTRLDYLQKKNLSVKVEGIEQKALAASGELQAAGTGPAVLKAAKAQVSNEDRAASTAEQEYPRTATVYFQTKRSLFTVFCGFLMAAAVAIPLGIMCGVNRVFMACMTPIISIFKPVSPVVWLLIFQIVIGAFFLPDPEKHGLFVFFGSLPFISNLGVNPALIFCACTVAMCAVWPALVNTALGVSSIDKDHMNVARVLRLGFWSRLFKIIIPSSLPLVFAGLRISLGVGWMVLIAAEALSSSDGLGKFVWDEYQNGSSHSFANIIYACFVIGIIGFFLDRIMICFQRLVSFDDGATAV